MAKDTSAPRGFCCWNCSRSNAPVNNSCYAGASVLLKKEDCIDLARGHSERAAADNLVHAELFFDPQAHTEFGMRFQTLICSRFSSD